MKMTFKNSLSATAVILALSLSACTRYETRTQANGSFEYQHATLVEAYQVGEFTDAEARDTFALPELSEQQKAVGLTTNKVDVRPPTQLIAVIDGVLLETTEEGSSKIWFNAFNQNDDMQAKVWTLLESYFAENNTDIINKDESQLQMETGILSQKIVYGSYFNRNHLLKEASYKFNLEKQPDGHSVALIVDVLTYEETNDGKKLDLNLEGSTKQDIELRFINSLLEFAYHKKESELLENGDNSPLAIKLGFDDNHQSAWIVDSEFMNTWRKLPDLFALLNIEIVESDKNLGYFLIEYSKPSEEYWIENNIKPFELKEAEYFIQLGEVSGGRSSISWLDEDKNPLSDQKITEIYLSITDHLRGALIKNDKQTQEF
ncbi:MAG: outer membrane protein assembly factor BamC [Psychromonas sp.]|nr:outer membrane protein assembly factor BamC [Psychromonas sp.]